MKNIINYQYLLSLTKEKEIEKTLLIAYFDKDFKGY